MRPAKRRSVIVGLGAGLAVAVGATLIFALTGNDTQTLKIDGPSVSTAPPARASGHVPTAGFERFDGSIGYFTDYAGSPLVVNFWSSSCVPCVKEMPAFEAVFRASKVKFLGIDVNDTLADGKSFAAKRGVTYDLGRDPRAELLPDFDATILPTTVFVGADGKILEVHAGALTANELAAKIAKHFG